MIYEGIDRWNSPCIEHHGVKGMKWGVRKQSYVSEETARLVSLGESPTSLKTSMGKRREEALINNLKRKRQISSLNPISDYLKRSKKRKIKKISNFAKRQSEYSTNLANRLMKSKTGDYDDEEYFEILPKSDQKDALARARNIAKEELANAKYWDTAYKDIAKSDSIKIAKQKLKDYKSKSYGYAPFI